MNSYEFDVTATDGIPTIFVKGYFTEEAGLKAQDLVRELLEKKMVSLIMDFSECKLINSPGVVEMSNLTIVVIDEYKCKLVLTGLDDLKVSVFEMVGILPMADQAQTISDAVQKIQV